MKQILLAFLSLFFLSYLFAESDFPAGVVDHGVATPASTANGVVTTRNAAGENLLLSFISDCRGCRYLLEINIDTGKSRTVELPRVAGQSGDDRPFASIRSSRGRYYTSFGGRFYEYDPAKGEISFAAKCRARLAMAMAEGPDGRIWAAAHPDSALVSFDPESRELVNYGSVHRADWKQYPRTLAVAADGWVYLGIGSTESLVVAYHPATKESRQLVPAELIRPGAGELSIAADGKIYARHRGTDRKKFHLALAAGRAEILPAAPEFRPSSPSWLAGSQFLKAETFADGRKIKEFNLEERRLVLTDADGKNLRTVAFDYPSEGANIMGVAATADGMVRGGTMFQTFGFTFDPRTDAFTGRGPAGGQWNALAADENHLIVGSYGHGILLDWDTALSAYEKPGRKQQLKRNPKVLGSAAPAINRPHCVAVTPDRKRVLMGGTPNYGGTGGGLAIFDRDSGRFEVVPPEKLLDTQSVYALLPLSDHLVLLGGTTSPGTGGRKLAPEAALALYDLADRKVVWREAVIPGVQSYYDLVKLPDGKVLVAADRDRLALFDPETRKLDGIIPVGDELKSVIWHQGPRIFHFDGENVVVLCTGGIGLYAPETRTLSVRLKFAEERKIYGGAIVGDRLFFSYRSRLLSYAYR